MKLLRAKKIAKASAVKNKLQVCVRQAILELLLQFIAAREALLSSLEASVVMMICLSNCSSLYKFQMSLATLSMI